jgi:Transcriptional regulator, AbiEi antitoxin, Type IV TA system
MLKASDEMKKLEAEAGDAIRGALSEISVIKDLEVELEPFSRPSEHAVDIVARFRAHDRPWTLICEVKSNGQPRQVRNALYQLRYAVEHYAVEHSASNAAPLLVASYLSPAARALCREHHVSYLDLEGNCRIAFDGVYIERATASRPPAARRELKSLFKPKSARVLRVLLRDPDHPWKVADLAQEADVSVGHVSNVRSALLDREWAVVDSGGLRLARPGALLDDWTDNYEAPPGQRRSFYTPLHGKVFEETVRQVMRDNPRKVVLASFSAAQWIAPYGRSASQFLYVAGPALIQVQDRLRAISAGKGDNLIITQLKDDGVLRDAIEPAPGVFTTGLIQTYLDLANAGERGREAADHLRQERLSWPN